MSQLFLAGRIVLGGFYLFNAVQQFTKLDTMAAFAAAHHVPLPKAAVLLSGLLLLLAGLSFLLGVLPKLGVAAAVAFLVPVSVAMHAFWADADPQARMLDLINFAKNMALAASSLMFLAIPEPWPYRVHARAPRVAPA